MQSIGMIRAAALGAGVVAALSGAATAGEYNLTVDRVSIDTGEFTRTGIGYNGGSPGPTFRFQEGEDVTIHVKNNLDEWTSVHWHGMILPYQQDGVPGLSFEGIAPGATHTYRFPMSQTGTSWYHSQARGLIGSPTLPSSRSEPRSCLSGCSRPHFMHARIAVGAV